jgi:tRNA threonylcarbamoyl adenosine modification protein YeaZ
MIEPVSPETVLAIESAIEGGSISLQREGRELDNWLGDRSVSRAEDILVNISGMLQRNKIEKKQIDLLAVSVGPGSYTGIRIGLATALGLRDALNLACSGISSLEAMVREMPDPGTAIVAVPVGRETICYQIFERDSTGTVAAKTDPIASKSPPDSILPKNGIDEIILHDTIFQSIKDGGIFDNLSIPVRNAGRNIAHLVGLTARHDTRLRDLKPIFVSPQS